jgi:hypothetical protein
MGSIDRQVGTRGLRGCRKGETDLAQADAVLKNGGEKVKNGSKGVHGINVNMVVGFTTSDSFCSRFCPRQRL